MINFFNKLSFTKKLILINIIVIFPVLIIGTIVSIIFITNNEKYALKEQVGAISELTASYSVADIVFNDKEALDETLTKLNVFPSIVYACILNNDNEIIATYGEIQLNQDASKLILNKKNRYTDGQLIYYNSIDYNNESMGTLVIVSDTLRLKELLANLYIGIIIGSIVAFLGLLIMSSRLQYFITKPISLLVSKIETVVKTGNYSIRIEDNPYDDEIGILNEDFNVLMNKIERTTVSKNYLDNVMDSLAEMLLVLDENGLIITINNAVTKFSNYQHVDLIGMSPVKIFGEELTKKILSGEITETTFQSYDGKSIFVSISITYFTDQEGLKRTILSIRDISKQKEAEIAINDYYKKLERTNNELEKLSYITSHDLKAPLRAVGSLVTMMEQDINNGDASKEEIDEYFSIMRKRINRMNSLINGILEYSKIGRERGTDKPVDLNNLVTEVIDTVVPSSFEVTFVPNFPTLLFNQTQLYQLFQNLIGNAVKYNDKEVGKIDISYQTVNHKHQFRIKDNGIGIAPKYQSKVFEVFQMLQARDRMENTGIGLSIVKKIVEQSGGEVWIESEGNQGTTFIFELPIK